MREGNVFCTSKLKLYLKYAQVNFFSIIFKRKGIEFLSKIPNLFVLGNLKLERLPIFSFLIRSEETGYYLHHNFVTRLLNDLFGIQSRAGCACAGPYAQYLLGINNETAEAYMQMLYKKDEKSVNNEWVSNSLEIFKPGFTRLNLPFFYDDAKIDYILNAIKFVCENGWKFLSLYTFDITSGEFKHRTFKVYITIYFSLYKI